MTLAALPSTIKNGDAEDANVVMSLFQWIQQQACTSTSGSSMLKADGSGNTTAAVAGSDYVAAGTTTPFRNVVINGNQSVDPNNGASVTYTAGGILAGAAEMFYAYCTGANVTGQQVQASDGSNRWRFTGAASVTGIGHGTRIEAGNSRHLAGKTCTVSVKTRNSLLTTAGWALYYANSADSFGTLASPTRTLIASGTFTGLSGTEATVSAQVNVPAAATTGLELVLTAGAQTSGQWDIGEVQIEPGAIPAAAVTFEAVDRGLNFDRTQRYFQRSWDASALTIASAQQAVLSTSSMLTNGSTRLLTTMRVAPSITYVSPIDGSVNSIGEYNTSGSAVTNRVPTLVGATQSAFNTVTASGTVGNQVFFHWSANARLF